MGVWPKGAAASWRRCWGFDFLGLGLIRRVRDKRVGVAVEITLDGMLYWLHFAYLESMGLWIVPYALTGLFFTAMASRRVKGRLRLVSVAFALALFFSLSLVVARMAAPVPTLFAVGLWVVDAAQFALNAPACLSSTEGCISPDRGAVVLLIPFLVQWALIYGVLIALCIVWRTVVAPRLARKDSSSAR